MEVVSGLMEPTSLQPTTGGSHRDTGWPNITASHSIPPTPAGGSATRTAGLQRDSNKGVTGSDLESALECGESEWECKVHLVRAVVVSEGIK